MIMQKRLVIILLLVFSAGSSVLHAQVGSYRSDFAIGFNGGYQLNAISFMPKVPQTFYPGMTGGITMRYIAEKYFNMICGVQAEVNYSRLGWRENILDIQDNPCYTLDTHERMAYDRTINYVQVPFLAHLGFGREYSGCKFFINLGPQFGYCIGESTKANFTYEDALKSTPERVSKIVAQDSMAVEKKFDYGITGGAGIEVSMRRAGHILLEARYYYGLGNLYGDSKADYFGRSAHGTIIFKMTYLFDLARTRKS